MDILKINFSAAKKKKRRKNFSNENEKEIERERERLASKPRSLQQTLMENFKRGVVKVEVPVCLSLARTQ